jgi:hypothetical protein
MLLQDFRSLLQHDKFHLVVADFGSLGRTRKFGERLCCCKTTEVCYSMINFIRLLQTSEVWQNPEVWGEITLLQDFRSLVQRDKFHLVVTDFGSLAEPGSLAKKRKSGEYTEVWKSWSAKIGTAYIARSKNFHENPETPDHDQDT